MHSIASFPTDFLTKRVQERHGVTLLYRNIIKLIIKPAEKIKK